MGDIQNIVTCAMRQWSTQDVGVAHRLDYWTGAICEAFLEMDCNSRDRSSFAGSLRSISTENIAFNQVVASTQDVFRTPEAIARSSQYPFYLITQTHTAWHVRQGGSMAQLRPGDAVLVDSAQRYELHFPDSVRCMSLQLPRAWLGSWLTVLDVHAPRIIPRDQGWGKSLSALNLQLSEDLGLIQSYPHALLSDQIGAMLAATLEPLCHRPKDVYQGVLDKATQLMRAQINCAGLTAEWISQELSISVRTLHRMFAAYDQTFATTLKSHRMSLAQKLLSEPRLAGLSIAEVGQRCGYADASHFARDFQRAAGLTPAKWRKMRVLNRSR